MANPDIPMKFYWMGRDIDELPREKLIEIIHHQQRSLEANRMATRSIIEVHELAAARRAEFRSH